MDLCYFTEDLVAIVGVGAVSIPAKRLETGLATGGNACAGESDLRKLRSFRVRRYIRREIQRCRIEPGIGHGTVLDVSSPVRANVHDHRVSDRVDVVDGYALVDAIEECSRGCVMEIVVLVLRAIVVARFEEHLVPIAPVDIESSEFVVIAVLVNGVDDEVFKPVGPE